MAVAFVQEFDVGDDRSTTNYDAFSERIAAQRPPEGLIVHAAGFTDDGVFRVFEVWESRDHQQRFFDDVLKPMLDEEPVVDPTRTNPPDRQYSYELHNVARP
jgi:hypothetical protein